VFRFIWFFGCIAVALLLGMVGQKLAPIALQTIASTHLPDGLITLLGQSSIVKFALAASLFALFVTFMGMGGQALVESLTLRRFRLDLSQLARDSGPKSPITAQDVFDLTEKSPDFAAPVSRYVASSRAKANEPLRIPHPADRFLSYEIQAKNRLHIWLYSSLFAGMIGLGIALFLFALVSGIDEMMFKDAIASELSAAALLRPIQAGSFALGLSIAAAVITRFMVRFFIEARRGQIVRLNAILDSLFLSNEASVTGLEKHIQRLADSHIAVDQNHNEQLGKMIDKALKRISDKFNTEFGNQIKATAKIVEDADKQVAKSTTAITKAHDTLAKYASGQSAAIDKAIRNSLQTHLKDDHKAADRVADAAAKAMDGFTADLGKAHAALIQTLEDRLAKLPEIQASAGTDLAPYVERFEQEITRLTAAITDLTNAPVPSYEDTGNAAADIIAAEYLKLVDEPDDTAGGLSADIDTEDTAERVGRLTEALRQNAGDDKTQRLKEREAGDAIDAAIDGLRNNTRTSDLPDG